jgi:iron complex outermembrane recepter protein
MGICPGPATEKLLAGEQETPWYTILHLRGGCKMNNKLRMTAGVENLFDRRYPEHLDWGGIVRPGRNFYVNLNYTFKR